MTNSMQNDYLELISFLENYNLSLVSKNSEFLELVKRIHKKYYSTLVLISEIKHQNPDLPIKNNESQTAEVNVVFWEYLEESLSELSASFFLLFHGCYKASKQVLRSSLENFFKALGCLENINIVNLKNTYEVIDIVSEIDFFKKGNFEQNIHNSLKQAYSELCATVHTAKTENMQNVSSLGYFPNVNIDSARNVEVVYIRVINNMLAVLCLIFDKSFHNMHHKNRDIVQLSLRKDILAKLYRDSKLTNRCSCQDKSEILELGEIP